MLQRALIFTLVALAAGFSGFWGLEGLAQLIAKILFFVAPHSIGGRLGRRAVSRSQTEQKGNGPRESQAAAATMLR